MPSERTRRMEMMQLEPRTSLSRHTLSLPKISIRKSLCSKARSNSLFSHGIGEPEDIANAIAFLAAPESGWITAQMLTVDGGRMDYVGHG